MWPLGASLLSRVHPVTVRIWTAPKNLVLYWHSRHCKHGDIWETIFSEPWPTTNNISQALQVVPTVRNTSGKALSKESHLSGSTPPTPRHKPRFKVACVNNMDTRATKCPLHMSFKFNWSCWVYLDLRAKLCSNNEHLVSIKLEFNKVYFFIFNMLKWIVSLVGDKHWCSLQQNTSLGFCSGR